MLDIALYLHQPAKKEHRVKRFALSLFSGLAAVALSSAVALASPPSLTGHWTILQTGANGSTSSSITLTQSGLGIVGTNTANGNGFTGTFVGDSQINGKWHGPGGAGWLTVYSSPNGHSLNGTWGYNGRPANGSFTGNKYLPPSALTAAGTWHVTAAGPKTALAGPMMCTQSGPSALCHVNGIIINGKFVAKDKIRATWTGGGRSGWFSFWFNNDNNSFNGTFGNGKDTTPAIGRVVGQRALG
jgi:hypothetical protein